MSLYPISPISFHGSISDLKPCQKSYYFTLANLFYKILPRGKGYISRLIGNHFGNSMKYFIKTKRNSLIVIERKCFDIYAAVLNRGGIWNEAILNVLFNNIKYGQVFYDVGSNIGYFTIELAHLFKDNINIISFEPQPQLAKAIAASAKLNDFKNIIVFDLLIGDKDGEMDLYLTPQSVFASIIPRDTKINKIIRRIVKLDSLVIDGLIPPPNVIKLDIEGAEFAALSGAKNIIKNYNPIIIFESDENAKRFGYSRTDILTLLSSYAPYDFYFIGEEKLIPITDSNINKNYSDICAIPKSNN